MERLTRRSNNGTAIYNTPSGDPVKWKNNRHEVLRKLAEYEDLEEQGLLLRLPCKVGDMVYTLNTLPSEKTVIGETTTDAFMCALCMLEGRFGKTIFLTRAEAEEALRKMNGTEDLVVDVKTSATL